MDKYQEMREGLWEDYYAGHVSDDDLIEELDEIDELEKKEKNF